MSRFFCALAITRSVHTRAIIARQRLLRNAFPSTRPTQGQTTSNPNCSLKESVSCP